MCRRQKTEGVWVTNSGGVNQRALAEGRIWGAGLDAFAEEPLPAASPLWDLPNVLIRPMWEVRAGGNCGGG
jgi:phosphoglycerate dehydrogenase-like enzyme